MKFIRYLGKTEMTRNDLRTAFRNLKSHKGFTAINILGLALGLATCLLIMLYVADELSYDRYNLHSSRIFRVNEDLKLGNNKVQYAVCMAPLAATLLNDFPFVESAVRLKPTSFHVRKGHSTIREMNVLFADPSIFTVFTLPLIAGNQSTALAEPKSIVISESMARKYFNSQNILGKSIVIDDSVLLKVTGIIKDLPDQSHFKADMLVSMTSLPGSRSAEWLQSNFNTYVLLKHTSDAEKLSASFPSLLRKYSGAQMRQELGYSLDAFEKGGSYFRLNLIALTDIHLHSAMTGELGSNGNVQYVYILSSIALAILMLACINFMNLSTARSSDRAREVGIRKVLGSGRNELIRQFLTESFLVTFLAVLVALVLVISGLSFFNILSGKEIVINRQTQNWLLPVLALTIFTVSILAGWYPALVLSSFQPIDVLKGKLTAGFKGGNMRSLLVIIQFAISIFLVIGTLVIYNQLRYIQQRELGYNRKQVLIIENTFELGEHAKTYKQEISRLTGIVSSTMTGFMPASGNSNTSIFNKEATGNPKDALFPQTWAVDADYIKTLDMKIIRGRNFSSSLKSDTSTILINETAARFLGLKDPVNKIIYRSSSEKKPVYLPFRIIGVVKDFNFSSLRKNISPLILVLNEDRGSIAIKVKESNIPNLIVQLEIRWKQFSAVPFRYSFMDANFEAGYRAEEHMGKIFIAFTLLAIAIACMGLFGLAAYAAQQRTREISIRKVLGASASSIIYMLSKDFIRLVMIAIFISMPLAWLIMHQWLEAFAYRENIQAWVFIAAAGGALAIAFITVSSQTFRAAGLNPVKGLKAD